MVKFEKVEVESVVIGARVSRRMYKAILKLLQQGSHISVSDYLRDVLRRDLKERGLLAEGGSNNGGS